MNAKSIPHELPMALEEACSLSLECWRLRRIVAELGPDCVEGQALRHASRRITEILGSIDIQTVDFAGRSYDPGMVPEVIEVREDQALPNGHSVIAETVAPTVTWRGQVVKPGQIILRRSTARPQASIEVGE